MLCYFAYFFGGAFFANSLPHLSNGMSGRAFPTPFATPPGKGESSALINVLWGMFNLMCGYVLIGHVGQFDALNMIDMATAGAGALLIAVYLAGHFGRLYGGAKSRSK